MKYGLCSQKLLGSDSGLSVINDVDLCDIVICEMSLTYDWLPESCLKVANSWLKCHLSDQVQFLPHFQFSYFAILLSPLNAFA